MGPRQKQKQGYRGAFSSVTARAEAIEAMVQNALLDRDASVATVADLVDWLREQRDLLVIEIYAGTSGCTDAGAPEFRVTWVERVERSGTGTIACNYSLAAMAERVIDHVRASRAMLGIPLHSDEAPFLVVAIGFTSIAVAPRRSGILAEEGKLT